MPRYKLIIEKRIQTEYWVNDYYYTATDLDDADSKAQPILDAEIAIAFSVTTFTGYRISTIAPDDGIFRTYPLNLQGSIGGTSQMLPLWNVLRVDFPAAQGRSGRKYLRGEATEENVNFDVFAASALAAFQTLYADVLADLTYLEKSNGVLLVGASVNPKVGMRQLRRGSRRRTQPII